MRPGRKGLERDSKLNWKLNPPTNRFLTGKIPAEFPSRPNNLRASTSNNQNNLAPSINSGQATIFACVFWIWEWDCELEP